MDKNHVKLGIVFICLGASYFVGLFFGLIPPGESIDGRIPPLFMGIGFFFLIFGLKSTSADAPIPQPIQTQPAQPQPPQQITKILVICPECGNRVSAEAKFCPECATSLMPKKP